MWSHWQPTVVTIALPLPKIFIRSTKLSMDVLRTCNLQTLMYQECPSTQSCIHYCTWDHQWEKWQPPSQNDNSTGIPKQGLTVLADWGQWQKCEEGFWHLKGKYIQPNFKLIKLNFPRYHTLCTCISDLTPNTAMHCMFYVFTTIYTLLLSRDTLCTVQLYMQCILGCTCSAHRQLSGFTTS